MQAGKNDFKVYPKRFAVVSLFSMALFMTSVNINTLTPIAKYLEIMYDQNPLVVNSGALLFALMHPIFTFPAAYTIDTHGTRVGITLGSLLCLMGTALRLLVNTSFAFVIVGQIVAGIGRPFILNCQAKISSNWFTTETRGGVTQILTLIMNISLIVGIFIPGIVFGKYNVEPITEQNTAEGKRLTFNLMAVEVILAIFCYVPNMIFQVNAPPTPPSDSGSVPRQPFKKTITTLFRHKNFILLLVAFGCYFGIFNALSIVLSYLLKPWFSDDLPLAVGIVGGSPVISGIIGVIIFGHLQRKSGKFKKYIVICMIGCCTAMLMFYPLLETNILVLVSLVSAYNSFFLIPLVPIMLELACQIAFPMGEGSAVGLLFAMGNFAGFVLGIFMTLIVQGDTKEQTLSGLAFCLGIFLIGLGIMYFLKQQRNRLNYDIQKSNLRRQALISEHEQGDQIIISDKHQQPLTQALLNPPSDKSESQQS